MGKPSPELKQLWIRVLKRVHPDLAIDEQDRIRCERLTQLANEAYQAGNIEALKAVLRPSHPPGTAAKRAYRRSWQPQQAAPPAELRLAKRSFKSWFWSSNVPGTAFSLRQLLPIAIALVILIWGGLSFSSTTTSPQVESVEAPIQAHVEVPDAGVWQAHPSKSPGDETDTTAGREGSATAISLLTASEQPYQMQGPPQAALDENSPEPSHLYMEQMQERLYQSFSNYERVDANVPSGNSSETWFDVNRDGSLSNVRIGKPSGWSSLDYACVRAVLRTETVGALPEDYKLQTLPATFTCTYTGSNALETSRSVDSAAERPDLYVGTVRNTTHE